MITPTNLSGRNANPEMLTSALFRCLNDLITRHATNLQADGCDEHTVRLAVERYRGQLLEQMLRMVITNGPAWFGCDESHSAFEAFPTSGVAH